MKMNRHLLIYGVLGISILGIMLILSRDNFFNYQENIAVAEKPKKTQNSFKTPITPQEAKDIIFDRVKEVTSAIESNNMGKFAKLVHPEQGIRFSMYGLVNINEDLVFSASEVKKFCEDTREYEWGFYPNFETIMELTPSQFFKQNIYNENFNKADQIGFNEIITSSGYPENQFDIYPDSIIVEYYFANGGGQNWRSVRFVFKEYQNQWYIVGIITNQWTS